MVSKKHSRKADQSTLASGGNEHAQLHSVAISWGNEMNFSLCRNMSGFCLDSQIMIYVQLLHLYLYNITVTLTFCIAHKT